MYSLQEIVERTSDQRKAITSYMDEYNHYDYNEVNLYQGQKRSVARDLRESLRRIPLHHLIQEYLVAGLAGASNLIPTKLADVLYQAAQPVDIVPLISADVVMGWTGGSMTVDIVDQYSLIASEYRDGGLPSRTMTTSQATVTPTTFGVPLISTQEMLEDSQYALLEYYASMAARGVAWLSNDLALTVLKTGTDGVGTVNSGTTGDADETKLTNGTTTDIVDAVRRLGDDRVIPNTMVTTPEAWMHSITMQAKPTGWDDKPPPPGFHNTIGILDVILSTSPVLHADVATDARGAAMTNCITLIFDRRVAMLTGRKRWLQIDNYSDPVGDLGGAVISARQDHVSLQDDAIFVLTET